jgi:hypothetical protein
MEMIKEKEFKQVGVVMIKPKIKDSLCNSCHHLYRCSITSNKNGVYQCSEFKREKFLLKTDQSETSFYDEPKPSIEALGLCKTCDNRISCSLKEEGTPKFYCEHYQ